MELNNFLEKFRGQLEDENTVVLPETNYVQSDFWDSLTAMVIKVMIEDDYGIDIPVEKLEEFTTVEQLYNHVAEQRNG